MGRQTRLLQKAPFLKGFEIKLEFKWVITGAGEAYFIFGDSNSKKNEGRTKPMLYENKALDTLCGLFAEYPEVLDEIGKARVALFNDAMLNFVPENERYDAPHQT